MATRPPITYCSAQSPEGEKVTTSGARLYFADNRAQEGHGQRSVRAGAVSIAARVVNAVVQVGSVIFLA